MPDLGHSLLGFRWDKEGYGVRPDLIRFVRDHFDYESFEVEFLMYRDIGLEAQGRIFDVESTTILDWLKVRGIPITPTLESAIDAAFNFGDVVYIAEDDRFLITQE